MRARSRLRRHPAPPWTWSDPLVTQPDPPASGSLATALASLAAVAAAASVGADVARAEGEALAATVAEPATGAYLDWCSQTGDRSGHGCTAEDFSDAASRGRRFRSGPTPTLTTLALARHPQALPYATALSEVCTAAATLGTPTARVMGNASTAAAAQLSAVRPSPRPPTGEHSSPPGAPGQPLTEEEMLRIVSESGRAVTQ